MRFIIALMLCALLSGCSNLPAEKLPEIPKESQPIYGCEQMIKHIEGHKILVFIYSNGNGGQFFALDLGEIKEKKP